METETKARRPSFASFKVMADANSIYKAQAVVEERVREAASRSGALLLGYQGGVGAEAVDCG